MSPQPLQHVSSRVLEFDSFREVLGVYLSSSLGKARAAGLAPTDDREWIIRQQQLAEEARRFLASGARFDFGGLFDAKSLLAQAIIPGAVLAIDEIRDTLLVIDKASEWREIALNPPVVVQENWTGMRELSQGIAD